MKVRRAIRAVAVALTVALSTATLAACSSQGPETIRFTFSKREAIPFMTDLISQYNSSQNEVKVELDTSGVDPISASFVRGNPSDLMLANYNMEVSRFVERCALSDLSDTDAAHSIRDDLQPLMDQYGVCNGRTSALPYSIMSAAVIYNKKIFAKYNIEVPQTWSELEAACKKLEKNGVTPFYATYKDDWTVGQGWFDYAIGSSMDVLDFFEQLKAEGDSVGPDSKVSFAKDFTEPMQKITSLAEKYTNKNANSRAYGDGNLAFSKGQAAMYLQGPWAFSEIAKTAPKDQELGTFPLPMTDNPDDLKVRVNVDLAAMIPADSKHKEAARKFLEYLYQPNVIEKYNESQLGFVPTKDAPKPSDPRTAGMVKYYNEGKVYQGPSVLVPKTIPVFSYAQAIMLGSDPKSVLTTMDADWARLAFRQPFRASESGGGK